MESQIPELNQKSYLRWIFKGLPNKGTIDPESHPDWHSPLDQPISFSWLNYVLHLGSTRILRILYSFLVPRYKRLYSRKHSSKQVADLSDVRGRLDGLRTDGRGGSLDTSSVDNTVLRKAIGASSEWWHMGTGSSISTKECCSQRTPDLENQAIAPQCSHAHLSSCAKVTLYTMEDRELT